MKREGLPRCEVGCPNYGSRDKSYHTSACRYRTPLYPRQRYTLLNSTALQKGPDGQILDRLTFPAGISQMSGKSSLDSAKFFGELLALGAG